MSNLTIRKFVSLDNSSVKINGTAVNINESPNETGGFMKQLYHFYKVSNLKFFKMDALSKPGFMAAAILLNDDDLNRFTPDQKAVVLANSSSSLISDEKHSGSMNEIPSPAVFVYTLPNIVTGEICIQHNLKGENTFFIQEAFDIPFMVNYINILFNTTATRKAITGWVEAESENNYRVFLMDVELMSSKDKPGNFTVDFINQIYKF